jgi:hypothetical protein
MNGSMLGTEESATVPRAGINWPRPTWTNLLAFGLITRVAIVVLGCLLAKTTDLPATQREWDTKIAAGNQGMHTRHHTALTSGPRRWIEPWYRFDAIWYAEISQRGYNYETGRPSTAAFLPLLPLVMAGGATLGLDRYAVGLVVPILAFPVGLALFGKAALRVTGSGATVWRACVLLVAYPGALFFSAPYQESLGFAFMAGAVLAWLDRRPFLASANLLGASAARLTAVSFSVAVVLEWAHDVARRRPARHTAWLAAASAALGLVLLFVYMGSHFGDATATLKAHAAWGRRPLGLGNVYRALAGVTHGIGKDELATVLFLLLGARAWWRRGPFWGALILVPIVQAMGTGTLMSVSRVALLAFPAFIDLAELLRNRVAFIAGVALSVVGQVYLIDHFVNWVFVA